MWSNTQHAAVLYTVYMFVWQKPFFLDRRLGFTPPPSPPLQRKSREKCKEIDAKNDISCAHCITKVLCISLKRYYPLPPHPIGPLPPLEKLCTHQSLFSWQCGYIQHEVCSDCFMYCFIKRRRTITALMNVVLVKTSHTTKINVIIVKPEIAAAL